MLLHQREYEGMAGDAFSGKCSPPVSCRLQVCTAQQARPPESELSDAPGSMPLQGETLKLLACAACQASLQPTMRLHLQAGLHAEATRLALSLESNKQQSLALQLAIMYDQEDMQGQARFGSCLLHMLLPRQKLPAQLQWRAGTGHMWQPSCPAEALLTCRWCVTSTLVCRVQAAAGSAPCWRGQHPCGRRLSAVQRRELCQGPPEIFGCHQLWRAPA